MQGARKYRDVADVIVATVLFLFIFQLITAFVEAIYAFGLLGTSIPLEIVSVLLFFAPVVLVVAPRLLGTQTELPLALLVIASRLVAVLLDTRGRMLTAGVGVAAAMLWLPLRLWRLGRDGERPAVQRVSLGLVTAVLLLILLRVAGSGLDPSTRGPFQALGWLLAALAVVALVTRRRPDDSVRGSADLSAPASSVSFVRLAALTLGLNSVLVMLH